MCAFAEAVILSGWVGLAGLAGGVGRVVGFMGGWVAFWLAGWLVGLWQLRAMASLQVS